MLVRVHTQLHSNKAFTLFELVIVMLAMAFLLSTVVPSVMWSIKVSKFKKAVGQMNTIADASVDYYAENNSWPSTLTALQPNYIPNVVNNPFGTGYTISGSNRIVNVTTSVPKGISSLFSAPLYKVIPGATTDTIQISKVAPYGITGRVEYEKKYLYFQ